MENNVIQSDEKTRLNIHSFIACIWVNSPDLNRVWKLIHISEMYYYFRDIQSGDVMRKNQDKFHSQIETGYYAVIQEPHYQ